MVPSPSREDHQEVIILGSYNDLYGGNAEHEPSYSVKFQDGGTLAWVDQSRMTFVRHATEEEVQAIDAKADALAQVQGDLDWICDNWASIKDRPPPASLNTLCGLVGITNPWGVRGEGANLYESYSIMKRLFGPYPEAGQQRRGAGSRGTGAGV